MLWLWQTGVVMGLIAISLCKDNNMDSYYKYDDYVMTGPSIRHSFMRTATLPKTARGCAMWCEDNMKKCGSFVVDRSNGSFCMPKPMQSTKIFMRHQTGFGDSTYTRKDQKGYTRIPAWTCSQDLIHEIRKGIYVSECATLCNKRSFCKHFAYKKTVKSGECTLYNSTECQTVIGESDIDLFMSASAMTTSTNSPAQPIFIKPSPKPKLKKKPAPGYKTKPYQQPTKKLSKRQWKSRRLPVVKKKPIKKYPKISDKSTKQRGPYYPPTKNPTIYNRKTKYTKPIPQYSTVRPKYLIYRTSNPTTINNNPYFYYSQTPGRGFPYDNYRPTQYSDPYNNNNYQPKKYPGQNRYPYPTQKPGSNYPYNNYPYQSTPYWGPNLSYATQKPNYPNNKVPNSPPTQYYGPNGNSPVPFATQRSPYIRPGPRYPYNNQNYPPTQYPGNYNTPYNKYQYPNYPPNQYPGSNNNPYPTQRPHYMKPGAGNPYNNNQNKPPLKYPGSQYPNNNKPYDPRFQPRNSGPINNGFTGRSSWQDINGRRNSRPMPPWMQQRPWNMNDTGFSSGMPPPNRWARNWLSHKRMHDKVLDTVATWANYSDNYDHFARLIPGPNIIAMNKNQRGQDHFKTIINEYGNCDNKTFCSNGGTCIQIGSIQHCICMSGFKGRHCQFKYSNQECGYETVEPNTRRPSEKDCVFPFMYNGVNYTNCTDAGHPGNNWCSTTVVYGTEWVYCGRYICKDVLPCPDFQCITTCQFGYMQAEDGCPLCACAENPCETLKCERGKECVLVKHDKRPFSQSHINDPNHPMNFNNHPMNRGPPVRHKRQGFSRGFRDRFQLNPWRVNPKDQMHPMNHLNVHHSPWRRRGAGRNRWCENPAMGPCPSEIFPECQTSNVTNEPQCEWDIKEDKCEKDCKLGYTLKKDGCHNCKCKNPCKKIKKLCPNDSKCAKEQLPCIGPTCFGLTTADAVCRLVNKPGQCSIVNNVKTWNKKKWKKNKKNKKKNFSLISDEAACQKECNKDLNCPGLQKCCRNGCGKSCVDPIDISDKQKCLTVRALEVEKIFTASDAFYHVTECDSNGQFKARQCLKHKTLDAKQITALDSEICHCVNKDTGIMIPNTKFKPSDNRTCEDLIQDGEHVECTEVCNTTCRYGHIINGDGCNTCMCKPSPCKTITCELGKTCHEVVMKQTCSDKNEQECEPIAQGLCLVSKADLECPKGDVLRHGKYKQVTVCSKTVKCPATYECILNRITYGICCPIMPEDYVRGYTTVMDKDCPYGDISKGGKLTKTASKCGQLCDSTKHCHAFVFKAGVTSANCWLKKSCIGLKPKTSSAFYKKEKHGECPSLENKYMRLEAVISYGYCDKGCVLDSQCQADQKCCETKCGGTRCVLPQINANSECQIKLQDALLSLELNPSRPVSIPRCLHDGNWQKVQCNDFFGLCWCVNQKSGEKMFGTTVRGTPIDCSERYVYETGPFEVCPDGQVVKHCNYDLCSQHECPQKDVTCRINPCGGCTAEFYDENNNLVDCSDKIGTCDLYTANVDNTITSMYQLNDLKPPFLQDVKQWIENIEKIRSGQVNDADQKQEIMRYKFIGERSKSHSNTDLCPRQYQLRGLIRKHECTFMCVQHLDCAPGQVCCSTGCGSMCWNPVLKPETCMAPKNDKCSSLSLWRTPTEKSTMFYFNNRTQSCEKISVCQDKNSLSTFSDGTENLFHTIDLCWSTCTDVYPMTSPVQPKCDGQGNFHTKQCHNGMCWCVAPDGTVAEGSLTKGKLDCDKSGNLVYTSSLQALCPDDSVPHICMNECSTATCYPAMDSIALIISKEDVRNSDWWTKWRRSDLKCQTEPCTKCKTTFYLDDQVFTCAKESPCTLPKEPGSCSNQQSETRWYFNSQEGVCKPFDYSGCKGNLNNFMDRHTCSAVCGGTLCPDVDSLKLCDDACETATCSGFPEAICTTDVCACKAEFIAPTSGNTIDCHNTKTLCERLREEAQRKVLLSPKHALELDDPVQCAKDNGSFLPQQCSYKRGECWCVNDMGEVIDGTTIKFDGDSSTVHACNKVSTKDVQMTFKFNNDFTSIAKNIEKFKRELKEKLAAELKIDAEYIKNLQVRRGSIIVEFTVIADGHTDLPSTTDLLYEKILNGKFDFNFQNQVFSADWQNATVASHSDIQTLENVELDTTIEEKVPDHETTFIVITTLVSIACIAVGVIIVIVILRRKRNKGNLSEDRVCFHNEPEPMGGWDEQQSFDSNIGNGKSNTTQIITGIPATNSQI